MTRSYLRRAFLQSFVALLLLVISLQSHANEPEPARQKFVLVGSESTKNSFHGRWLSLIYTELFERLGMELDYQAFPSARASFMSDNGLVDGEINRVASYLDSHPDMIRVNEAHFTTRIVAYAVKPGIKINSWESLKHSDYLIDFRRGTVVVERNLERYTRAEQLHPVIHVEQAIHKLLNQRTDLYIGVETLVDEYLSRIAEPTNKAQYIYKAGVLVDDTLHLYLHKKNKVLSESIETELKRMKEDGSIDAFKLIAIQHDN